MSFVNAYNFIPLKDGEKRPLSEYYPVKNAELLTGKIECRLTIKTPLIIPDHEKSINDNEYPFMTVGGKPMIPGSSLRGMVRNAFEAITDSCIPIINNDYLYSSRSKKPKIAGLLKKRNDKWILYKADRYSEGINGKKSSNVLSTFETGEKINFNWEEKDGRLYITGINNGGGENVKSGYILIMNTLDKGTGKSVFVNKNIELASFNETDEQFKAFRKNIEMYKKGAAGQFATVYETKLNTLNSENMLPVWYEEYKHVNNGEEKTNFYMALSQLSRNVFINKPNDLLANKKLVSCKNKCSLCPACAFFGFIGDDSESIGSYVRFSDAFCENDEPLKGKAKLLLSSPHSSSFEFYLRDENGGKNYHADYDSVTLAGRKFYWHNNKFNPTKNFLEGIESDYIANAVDMEYINENETFIFYVYFDNITPKQLNILYTSLTYGDNKEEDKKDKNNKMWNLCHKLGHGKSVGFGSVKVTVKTVDVRKFNNGEYTVDYEYLNKVKIAEFSDKIRNAVNFYAVKGELLGYPKYPKDLKHDGTIMEWFSENRKFPNNQYYQVLPKITDSDDSDQTMPDVPKQSKAQTNHISSEILSKGDIRIICRDCGNEFLFTVGEQNFYKEKGFNNQPTRCKPCKEKNKQKK